MLEHEPTLALFEDGIRVVRALAGRVAVGPGLGLLLVVLLLLLVHLLLPGLRGHVRAPLPLGRGLGGLHEAVPLGAIQAGLWHVFDWHVWNGQQRLLDLGCAGSRFLPRAGDEDIGQAGFKDRVFRGSADCSQEWEGWEGNLRKRRDSFLVGRISWKLFYGRL